jgi:hypothetical protein
MKEKIKIGDTVKGIHNNSEGKVTEIKKGKTENIIHYGERSFSVESLLVKS